MTSSYGVGTVTRGMIDSHVEQMRSELHPGYLESPLFVNEGPYNYATVGFEKMKGLDGKIIFLTPEWGYFKVLFATIDGQQGLYLQDIRTQGVMRVTEDFNFYTTTLAVKDNYYGTLLTEDMDQIVKEMHIMNGTEITRSSVTEMDVFEHVKTRFLDSLYQWVYSALPRQRRWQAARSVALVLRNYVDAQYEMFYNTPYIQFEDFNSFPILPGYVTLGQLVNYYSESIKNGTPVNTGELDMYGNFVMVITQLMETAIETVVEQLMPKMQLQSAQTFVQAAYDAGSAMDVTDREFFNSMHVPPLLAARALKVSKKRRFRISKRKRTKSSGKKNYRKRKTSIISRAVRQRNMSDRDPRVSWENKLSMVLEPRHDFVAGRYKNAGNFVVSKTVERLTNDYINAHRGPRLPVNTNGSFERKNYLEYSAEFDDSRYLQVYGHDNPIADESTKGIFYASIKEFVEKYIIGKPVVRDAKGTSFLRHLFGVIKESKSAEIAIDAASGNMEIGQDGIILVDYPNEIFKIPQITPSGYDPQLTVGQDAVGQITNIGKFSFGISHMGGGTPGWNSGTPYSSGDRIVVEDRRVLNDRNNGVIHDKLSVTNLVQSMVKINRDKQITPEQRDIAFWSCFNFKRAGDQGQALYAQKIGGVFDTLDFLAAAYASVKNIDYMVNSNSLNNLYVRVKTIMSYSEFKISLISWAERTAVATKFSQMQAVIPNLITDVEREFSDDERRMNFLSMFRELVGSTAEIYGSLQGKIEVIGQNLEKFFGFISSAETHLAISTAGLDRPSAAGSKLKNAAVKYASYLTANRTICSFFESTFKFISRINAAVTFLNTKLEKTPGLNSYLAGVVRPLIVLLNRIFEGIVDIERIAPGSDLETSIYGMLNAIQNTELETLLDRFKDLQKPERRAQYTEGFGEFFDLIRNLITLNQRITG